MDGADHCPVTCDSRPVDGYPPDRMCGGHWTLPTSSVRQCPVSGVHHTPGPSGQ